MRTKFTLRFLLLSGVFLFSGYVHGQDQKVKFELADMVEAVAKETNFRMNISEMNFTSVNINKINGRNVCSKEAKKDVMRLQQAFNNHPNIYKNIGPYLVSFSYKDGSRKIGDITSLRNQGVIPGCTNIFVSVH